VVLAETTQLCNSMSICRGERLYTAITVNWNARTANIIRLVLAHYNQFSGDQ